jgi:hypothetical protein
VIRTSIARVAPAADGVLIGDFGNQRGGMTGLRTPRTRERARPAADLTAVASPRVVSRHLDPIRWSRIAAVQRRLAAGYYDRLEIQRAVVKALLEQLERS